MSFKYVAERNELPHTGVDNASGSTVVGTARLRFWVVAAEVLAVCSFILLLVWLVRCQGGFAWNSHEVFNYHVFFMIFGMTLMYGNAAILFRALPSVPKPRLKLIHAVIHILVFIFMVIGVRAVFKSKELKNRVDMYTLHSWVGMGAIVGFSCQLALGFTGFLWPKFPPSFRVIYLKAHVFFGSFILMMVFASIISGLTSRASFGLSGGKSYSDLSPETFIINFLGVFLTLFLGIVFYILHGAEFKRLPDPSEG